MVRKNPLSSVDIGIARRLVHLRKEKWLSRDDLARKSEVDFGIISRVELCRMPLRYEDARKLLAGLFGNAWMNYNPINPLWLCHGNEPKQLNWPFLLPAIESVGLDRNISFSEFVSAHHGLLVGLAKEPPVCELPESWLCPYYKHWCVFDFRVRELGDLASRVGTVFARSAERQAALHSLEASQLLAQYKQLTESLSGEKNLLTPVSENSKSDAMKSDLQKLLDRVRDLTRAKGTKGKLADAIGISQPRLSEWLAGKYEPSGDSTLKLLRWVQHQDEKSSRSKQGRKQRTD